MSKAYEIFRAAFDTPRDLRSDEYKNGVLDVLRFRLGEVAEVRCGYRIGSAQADAYFSGCDEGHRRAREHLEKVALGDTETSQNATTQLAIAAGATLYADTLCINGKDADEFIHRFAALVSSQDSQPLAAELEPK